MAPAKESKTKKAASAPKKHWAHPPYSEMINEAIVAMKERTGSSQIAIAKFIDEKQKSNLPPNFKKLLLIQLKKLVANGKLVKVKNSFKLPPKTAPVADTKPQTKPKTKARTEAPAKQNVTAAKRKAAAEPKPKKAAKTTTAKSAAVKTPLKKKTPVKGVKKPKSIKSPAKKASAKKAKK